MEVGEQNLHIAMLPWLAFGHMIPYLQLAVAFAKAGIRVSFLSTPRNILRLPTVPPHLRSLISFVPLPLAPVEGLPALAEATIDVAAADVPLLKIAYDLLQNPVKKFLIDESPDCVIHDFLPYWTPAAARDAGVPTVLLLAFNAATVAFFGPLMAEDGRSPYFPSPESLTSPPDWLPSGSTVAFRIWEAEGFYPAVFTMNASGITDIARFQLAVKGCTAVAFRSCPEFEGEYLDLLRRLYRKPVFPIGLLPPPSPPPPQATGGEDDNWGPIFRWLDAQPPKSVVFVSFGSEYKLTGTDVRELAYGLELSNVPFLWALRRPPWVTGGDEEALPKGFIDRTEGRGVVRFGWAPQLEILAHPSVGASLFHSGWGSIVETLRYANALIVLPNIFDQGLNARLLVEKGIAIEVERGDDGSFDRHGVAKALKMAMVSSEGERLRTKAREMATVFADQQLHDRYLKEFIDFILKARNHGSNNQVVS